MTKHLFTPIDGCGSSPPPSLDPRTTPQVAGLTFAVLRFIVELKARNDALLSVLIDKDVITPEDRDTVFDKAEELMRETPYVEHVHTTFENTFKKGVDWYAKHDPLKRIADLIAPFLGGKREDVEDRET